MNLKLKEISFALYQTISFKEFQNKLDLITFFQFLVYARVLEIKQSLVLRIIVWQLRVQDFLHYIKRSNNYHQLDKLIKFFDQLQQNSLIQVFRIIFIVK